MEHAQAGLGIQQVHPVVDQLDARGIDLAQVLGGQAVEPARELIELAAFQIGHRVGLVHRVREQQRRDVVNAADLVDALLRGQLVEHGDLAAHFGKTLAHAVELDVPDLVRRKAESLVIAGADERRGLVQQPGIQVGHGVSRGGMAGRRSEAHSVFRCVPNPMKAMT